MFYAIIGFLFNIFSFRNGSYDFAVLGCTSAHKKRSKIKLLIVVHLPYMRHYIVCSIPILELLPNLFCEKMLGDILITPTARNLRPL